MLYIFDAKKFNAASIKYIMYSMKDNIDSMRWMFILRNMIDSIGNIFDSIQFNVDSIKYIIGWV